MKFAEIIEGSRLVLGPVTVDEEQVVAFAKQYDTQWFHMDPERAASGPWNGVIASGWHTCVLAMQLVSKEILAGSEGYASPGLQYVRWPNPMRPGDLLTLEVLVLESRISVSKPWLGVVRWQWLMKNQDGAEVLALEATSMFKLAQ
jgi:acyl dehydratase